MALPELYKVAKEGHWFGLRRFGYFMLQGAYQVRGVDIHKRQYGSSLTYPYFPPQSAVVFFFINYAYTTTTARTDGYIHHSVFEYTYLLFWNIFWTLLPVIALGLFDLSIVH
jgi:phospholipid-translocating ATPase